MNEPPDSREPEHDGSLVEPEQDEAGSLPQRQKKHGQLPAARHRARTLALQALYEADSAGHDPAVTVERLIADLAAGEQSAAYARTLVAGIKATRAQVDEHIRDAATQWPVDQLAAVDRNILRIAIYEMLICSETPVRVAVNEAVELAKAYGSDTSARFVNGVLGALSARRDS